MNSFSMPPRPSKSPTLSVLPNASVRSLFPNGAPKPGTSVLPVATTPAPEKARAVNVANKAVVGVYKVVGFGMLTAIVGGLVSYLGVNAFYFADNSWAVPTVLTPNDDRVVKVDTALAQETVRHDALVAQRMDLDAQLAHANRVDASETAFQSSFKVAVSTDLANRASSVARFQALLAQAGQTKADMADAGKAYAGMSKGRVKDEYSAHLISKDAMINGNYQLAQLAGAQFGLSERDAEVADRVANLTQEVRSLRTLMGGAPNSAALTYEGVRMQHTYDTSALTAQKAREDIQRLQKNISMIDKSITASDAITKKLGSSPYALAGDQKATMIFVPYENLGKVAEGAPVYACKYDLVVCSDVGNVGAAVDGEVVEKHPVTRREVRGVMKKVVLRDGNAGQKAVLHIGRKPLFF